MGLFHSYQKEGKGIKDSGLRPIRPLYFFQILIRKLWKLCQLNILYVILTLPIWINVWSFVQGDALNVSFASQYADGISYLRYVGQFLSAIGIWFIIWSPVIGPATAGMTHLLKCFSTETPVFLYSEFFEHFKKNFKQATLMSIINGILLLSLSYTLVYANSPLLLFGGQTTLGSMQLWLLIPNIFLVFMTYYAYTMMVTFRLKFSDIIKNSFIFALAKLPLNLFIGILIGLTSYYTFFKPMIGVAISAIILYAFCGFLVVFSIYPTIEKHMLIPAKKLSDTNENEENEEV